MRVAWLRTGTRLKVPRAQPNENGRRNDQDVEKAANHSTNDWRSQRLHDFRPGPTAPHDWQQAGDDRCDRHHLRPESESGAFLDCRDQVGVTKSAAELRALSF